MDISRRNAKCQRHPISPRCTRQPGSCAGTKGMPVVPYFSRHQRMNEENYESGELPRKRKEKTTEDAEDAERKSVLKDTTNALLAFCFSHHSIAPMSGLGLSQGNACNYFPRLPCFP